MKDPFNAAFVGSAAGVLTTASLLLLEVTAVNSGLNGEAAAAILITTTMVQGLVFVVAGLILSGRLLGWAEQGRSRGTILSLGLILGLSVTITELLLFMACAGLLGGDLTRFGRLEFLIALGSITAGGGSMGLGCAWWISRPTREGA